MDYHKEFFEISGLLMTFNQDWVPSYDWKGREPTFQPIIRYFKTTEDEETVNKLIYQLERLLALPLDEDEFERVVGEELGSEYTPQSQGLNDRQFLEESLKILKEPMEETKIHFIPEFVIYT